ncbi:hypothetical protein M3Y99_01877000 [Aphelenchoides fujianensis]|nr:hypothetical protein M3Y99_01877000 [Aphelenchoides fujianensis]
MYFSNGNLAYPTNNHYGVPHSAAQPPPPPPISHTSSVLSGLLSQPPVFQPPPGFNPVPGIFYPPTIRRAGRRAATNSAHSSPALADQKPLKVRMARKTVPNSPPEEAPASTSPGMKPGEDVEKYRSRRDRNNASARVSRIRRKEREQKLQALAGMERYLDLVNKLSTI